MNVVQTASITALLLLGGCGAASGNIDQGNEAATVSSADIPGVRDGQTRLRVGQTLSVGLTSNATTGYLWQVTGMEGGVLTEGVPFGEEITDPHAPGMVGVGGVTHWRFVAGRPGTVTLRFAYARPWERDTPPAETATYRVTVR